LAALSTRFVRAAAAPKITTGAIQELPTVMFAYSKYIQSNLIGAFNLFDQSLLTLGRVN
jgi:hypothetical protein